MSNGDGKRFCEENGWRLKSEEEEKVCEACGESLVAPVFDRARESVILSVLEKIDAVSSVTSEAFLKAVGRCLDDPRVNAELASALVLLAPGMFMSSVEGRLAGLLAKSGSFAVVNNTTKERTWVSTDPVLMRRAVQVATDRGRDMARAVDLSETAEERPGSPKTLLYRSRGGNA